MLSCVQLFGTPWTVAHQGIFPIWDQIPISCVSDSQAYSLPLSHLGSPKESIKIKLLPLQWRMAFLFVSFLNRCSPFQKSHWIQLNNHLKRGEYWDQKNSRLRKVSKDNYVLCLCKVWWSRWGTTGHESRE